MPEENIYYSDFLIIGGGIAGLSAALEASRKGKVILLTKGKTGESATEYAQGGIACAIDEQKDSPIYHLEDTLLAGAGLCDKKAVEVLVKDGVRRVYELIELGARFDKIGKSYELTLEGAHKHRRILHAGDATGAEIERALAARILKEKLVEVKNFIYGKDLIIKNGRCLGALAADVKENKELIFISPAVILATGGLCQVYLHNTNPKFATGDGVAMAYRAGAEVQDMEFIQFHPTALFRPGVEERSLLISEAVRGEGGILLNTAGERFMSRYHPNAELAPRDIVSRAILKELKKTNSEFVYLSLEKIEKNKIKSRFPTIYESCLEHSIDITKDRIPVSPSAHYFMGGVNTNINGETNIEGLYAAGEVASLGIHGANRLASNSLLDGLVFGHRAAQSATNYMLEIKEKSKDLLTSLTPEKGISKPSKLKKSEVGKLRLAVKKIMWQDVGIVRSEESLKRALNKLDEFQNKLDFTPMTEEEIELKNMVLVSKLIAKAALDRTESRGAHYRSDFPKQDDKNWKRHLIYKQTT